MSPRPVNFGNVFLPGCNIFPLYLRYLVLSTTTGADYLYFYRSTGSTAMELYADSPQIVERSDTIAHIEFYIMRAYKLITKKRRPEDGSATARDDLAVMKEFWQAYHGPQDTITICLEIQQRLLYD